MRARLRWRGGIVGRVEALQDAAQLIAIVLGVGAVPFLMDWVEGRLPAIPRGPRPTSPVARSRGRRSVRHLRPGPVTARRHS